MICYEMLSLREKVDIFFDIVIDKTQLCCRYSLFKVN